MRNWSFSFFLTSETASEEDSPMPPCSRLNSESSVPEELSNLVESIPSKVSEIQDEPGSLDHTLTEEIVYTQEPESSVSSGKPVSEFDCPFAILWNEIKSLIWILYYISK